MCDPVSLSIASTVVGAAGTAANAFGQMGAQKKQKQEVDLWQAKQKQDRVAEQGRQENLRQQAEAAQQAGAQQVGGEGQTERQGKEEARLADYLLGQSEASTASPESGAPPVAAADATLLSGQQGGDENFQTDLAKKVHESSKGAEQRIKALARVSSFGESFGGLGRDNPILQAQAGQGIDLANEKRRGSLGAFEREKAVNPVQVTYTPSPLASIFSQALSFGSMGMGGSFGNPFSGGEVGANLPQTTNIIPTSKWQLPQTTTAIPMTTRF
jgi:hypothetical protein